MIGMVPSHTLFYVCIRLPAALGQCNSYDTKSAPPSLTASRIERFRMMLAGLLPMP